MQITCSTATRGWKDKRGKSALRRDVTQDDANWRRDLELGSNSSDLQRDVDWKVERVSLSNLVQ